MATVQSAGGSAAAENSMTIHVSLSLALISGINSDGSMEKILPNGQMITTSGAGSTSSVGEASYHKDEEEASAATTIANNTKTDNGYNIDTST